MALPEETKAERLMLLGIDSTIDPTVSRMPRVYNPIAHKQWRVVITDLKLTSKPEDNWLEAIRLFLKACKAAGVEVYDEDNIEVHNQGILDWLKSNRVKTIKYCNEANLFKNFGIRSVRRSVKVLGAYGERKFVICVEAKLKAIEDPTLEKWLLENPIPGFIRKGKLCVRDVNSAVAIEFNLSSKEPSVTVNILCHSIPMIPNRRGAVTLKALAKYVEQEMWMPLVRRMKFKNVGTKLF